MAIDIELKTLKQNNTSWPLTFKASNRFPIVANRVFATLENAQKYIDDTAADASAYPGIVLAVVQDEVAKNNGVYYVKSVAMTEGEKGVLVKVGGAETETADNYSEAKELSKTLVVGQLIKVTEEETIGEETYQTGFYIVESPGVISALATSTGSDDEIGALKARVDTIEGDYITEDELESAINAIDMPNVPVQGVKYGEDSLLDENGIALLDDFAKSADVYLKEDANSTFVKSEGYVAYSDAEKSKLANIAEGAQVNVLEGVKVNNVELVIGEDKKVNIDLLDYVQKDGAKVLSTNDFTDDLKSKLEGIDEGAEVNFVKSVGDNLNVDGEGKLTVTIPSVATDDKVLTLGDDGVLKSDLEFVKETIYGDEYLVVKGKNGGVIGKVATAEFTVDGILDNVEFSTEEGKENILVLTFNADSGKQDIEVDFGKYVDAYSAGTGLTLSDKAFAVDFNAVAKKSDLDALADIVGTRDEGDTDSVFTKLAALAEKNGEQDTDINAKADKSELDALAALVGKKAEGETPATGIFAELAALEKLTVNGVGIDNGTITLDSADIKLNAVIGKKEVDGSQVDRYTIDKDIQYVLNDIDTRIDAINTTIDNVTGGGVIADITAGDGINVDKTTKTNPTISVKVDDSSIKVDSNKKIAIKLKESTDNALVIEEDGLYVQAITIDGNDIEQ